MWSYFTSVVCRTSQLCMPYLTYLTTVCAVPYVPHNSVSGLQYDITTQSTSPYRLAPDSASHKNKDPRLSPFSHQGWREKSSSSLSVYWTGTYLQPTTPKSHLFTTWTSPRYLIWQRTTLRNRHTSRHRNPRQWLTTDHCLHSVRNSSAGTTGCNICP